MTSRDQSLYRPRGLVDVLQVPFIGRILKSRWGRLTLQVPLLVIAVLAPLGLRWTPKGLMIRG